ncbi:MAG: calcium-binding protein [Xenococcaceae cyanobacterium]
MAITISGQTATSDLNINAPSNSQTFSAYFIDLINDNNLGSTPQVLTISQPTTATDINLTSFGKIFSVDDGFDGSAWRIRNGADAIVDGNLTAYGTGLINTYELPANTDTFVISPVVSGSATHILEVDSVTKTKASSSDSFEVTHIIGGESYELIGGSGDDTLRGAGEADILIGGEGDDVLIGRGGRDTLTGDAGDDVLIGRGGRDTLTGGAGSDRFQFNNQGRDEITDFSLSDGDIIQIETSAYSEDAQATIYIDTFQNIRRMGTGNFAYATDRDRLFYDADGDWQRGNDRQRIVDTNDFGDPTEANFEFM